MSIGDGVDSPNQRRHLYVEQGTTVGFFTDPTLCIGCKACEVACKEWNELPLDGLNFSAQSYDNTGALGAATYRHVKFVELDQQLTPKAASSADASPFTFMFLSDVCKHCEHAGCLEACPTGSILRTEVGSVYVQDDICNGCGYCVVSCPFGVIDRRPAPLTNSGGAFKCTFCYDRQVDGLTPACAKTCPTESIAFGPLDQLRERARRRVGELEQRGYSEVRVYDPQHTSVGGVHALFLTLGAPEALGLPPHPEAPTRYLASAWASALASAVLALLIALFAFGVAP